MTAINKINKLKNSENFLQINFMRGYEYIDNAGKALNYFIDDDEKPVSYDMNMNRLIIIGPDDDIEQLKISSSDLWVHFNNESKFDKNKQNLLISKFSKFTNDLLPIINVREVERCGWRTYLIYDLGKKMSNFNKLAAFTHGDLIALATNIQDNGVDLTIRINLLRKKADESKQAIMFDVDASLKGRVEVKNITDTFQKIGNSIHGKVLLRHFNDIIEKYG